MPSGYTEKLYKTDQSFEEFVWTCAHGMGALYHLRDESCKSKITFPEACSYYVEELPKTEKELKEFLSLSDEQLKTRLDYEHKNSVRERKESRKVQKARLARYSKMLKKVESWNPPTKDHEGLKRLLIEQLKDSIDFDCYGIEKKISRKPAFKKWKNDNIKRLTERIEYYKEQIQKEKIRHNKIVNWIKTLDSSVPCPTEMKGW